MESIEKMNAEHNDKDNEKKTKRGNLIYKVNDNPPWYLCILFGFQHYVTMLGGDITYPYILTPKLCIRSIDPARSYIIATTIFVSGLATLIQSTFGIRLPIVQGSSFAFLIPTLTILNLPKWECPTYTNISNVTEEEYTEVWQMRMREVQGAIIIGSLFEVFIGMTGIVGFMLRWITPLAIAPTVALIGLNLFSLAAKDAGESWIVSGITIILMILFSQYLAQTNVPIPAYNKQKKIHVKRMQLFGLIPVLLTMGIVWLICGIFTGTNVFPIGHAGRTDKGIQLLRESPWFYFPYPFQWGAVTISVSSVLAIIAGIFASVVESIGDYYACASLSEAPPPPTHAVNRGIFMEGIGCVLSGMFGAGCGVTSYSQNIGAIGITRVGSRRVVQYAALVIIVASCVLKFSAMLAAMPTPIIGGIFCAVFGIITSVGLSPLQFVDLNSARNLFVLGFSIFMGMVLPKYFADNPRAIQTGNEALDQIITVLLSTGMFVGGFLGFLLDNTIPGTDEERGVIKWLQKNKRDSVGIKTKDYDVYDAPLVNRLPFNKYIPICPGYSEDIYLNMLCKRRMSKYNVREHQNTIVDERISSV